MKFRWVSMALASTISLRAADIAEIRSIMANRVDSGKAVSIVTGVIDEKGRQVSPPAKYRATERHSRMAIRFTKSARSPRSSPRWYSPT